MALHRPVELAAVIGELKSGSFSVPGNPNLGLNGFLHCYFRVTGKTLLQQPRVRIGQSRKQIGSRKREQVVPNLLVGKTEFNDESLFTAFAMVGQSTVGESELFG